jgi:hypothetical protein
VLVASAQHLWFWQTPSWNWSEIWALLVLLAMSSMPIDVPKKRSEASDGSDTKRAPLLTALINGQDGRWSTSKASAVLWTYAVWFAFITILLHTNAKGIENAVLKQQYLLLLGLPVGAAVVAKGITQSKVEAGKIATKQPDGVETNALRGISQLITNDSRQPDLLDFQYFGFNFILLAYFFTRFLGHQSLGLPELPDSLVALSGISAAGYLSKKGLQQDTNPVITGINPPEPGPGDSITIRGANLATRDELTVSVKIADQDVPVSSVVPGEVETKIETAIPTGVAAGKATVQVVNYRGMKSDPYPITITVG